MSLQRRVGPINQIRNGSVSASRVDKGARVFNSVAELITNAVLFSMDFDSEEYDTDTMHDLVINTDRITFTTKGVYLVFCNLQFAANAAGTTRQVFLWHFGTGPTIGFINGIRTSPSGGAIASVVSCFATIEADAGDYIELSALQNSGGGLNGERVVKYSAEMSAQLLTELV